MVLNIDIFTAIGYSFSLAPSGQHILWTHGVGGVGFWSDKDRVCGKNIYFTLLLMYETWLMLTVLMFAFAFEVQRNQSREVKDALVNWSLLVFYA